jgi:uncharacterized protein
MRGGILALGLIVAVAAAAVAIISLVRVPNMYAIEGRGEVKYTPDAAEITSSIYAENDVSVEAVKEAAATMRQILAALKTAGVAAEDVKSADVRSGLLDLDGRREPAGKVSYYAEQIVVIQVRDITRIGKILDAIARAGSNYWLVKYRPTNRETIEAAARKAAFLNAVATADVYAKDGDFTRGRVLKVQDDAVSFPEIDYPNRDYRLRRGSRSARGSDAEAVVVTGSRIPEADTTFDIPPPREVTVSATTQVLFEIE